MQQGLECRKTAINEFYFEEAPVYVNLLIQFFSTVARIADRNSAWGAEYKTSLFQQNNNW